ncbi:MAG TPA: AraC family transcriptional regulator ligand-binding domain-containing protein [Anaeromyxobacteraceae bacterium]
MALLPAATARALLAAFRALGLDSDDIRAAAGIAPDALAPLDGALPGQAFGRLWEEALRRAPREELPTEAGLALPFGAFGALDYLAASAATVEAAFGDLASHFRYAAGGFRLEVARGAEGGEVRLLPCGPEARADRAREVSDEFTLAVFAGRFRSRVASSPFRVTAVRLTRPPPARPTRHEALFRAPVLFGCAVAALDVPLMAWTARLAAADPGLQATLRQLADRIGLGAEASGLEASVRARLRSLLPGGAPDAARIASSLGVSERTLHRRLRAQGRSFRAVLEDFREAEAERLLTASALPLPEVALRLGFSDQTAWNRAFKRWKGMAPRAWLASRSAGAAPARSSPARPPRRRS